MATDKPGTISVELGKVELEALAQYHMHHAKELQEAAAMVEEENIDGSDLKVFAVKRLSRAISLLKKARNLDSNWELP